MYKCCSTCRSFPLPCVVTQHKKAVFFVIVIVIAVNEKCPQQMRWVFFYFTDKKTHIKHLQMLENIYSYRNERERERDYNNKFIYLMWIHSTEPMRGLLIRNNDNSHRFLLIMPWFVSSFFRFCRWTCSSNEKHVLHRIEDEPDTKAFGLNGREEHIENEKKELLKERDFTYQP